MNDKTLTMKLLLLSIIISFSISPIYGQCIFGFERIITPSGDDAMVIKKHGFPNNTQFRLIEYLNYNADTIVHISNSQTNDTISFATYNNLPTGFHLTAISPAQDTLGSFKSGIDAGYPLDIDLIDYIAPTNLTSNDGELHFSVDSLFINSVGFVLADNYSTHPIALSFDSIPAGIHEFILIAGFYEWRFKVIMGNPEEWVNVDANEITCPIGINLATDLTACDGEAYIGQVQNGVAPYTYDWNGTGAFVNDTLITGLCVETQFVIIKDHNDSTKTCAFAMGSLDFGYFPPVQQYDTIIHTFVDYCVLPGVDSISVIGSQVIDSVTISVLWSFYENSILVDQLLDFINLGDTILQFNNIALYGHFICNGSNFKSTTSVFSTCGYLAFPFTEVGFLSVMEFNKDAQLNAFPNPFSKLLNIDISEADVKSIVVLNNLGQQVNFNRFENSANQITLDFSGLDNGIYMVRVLSKDNKLSQIKAIKN